MSFSPAFLAEIRDRLPLSDVAGKRIRLTRAGREYKACCPFHNEKSPSFTINDDKQFYHCFGCGAHGDVIGFVMQHDKLSFPDAVELLAPMAGLQVPRDTPIERERFDKEKRLYQLLDRATAWFEEQLFAPAGREALAYLHKRGLSDEAIRRFRLGYAPNDGQALIKALTQPRHARAGGHPSPSIDVGTNSENDSLPRPQEMDSRFRGNDIFSMDELIAVGLVKKAEDRDEVFSFFRHRVMFPVGDRRGRTVAFGGRVLGDGEPKYLNSPDHALFHKGKLLYGLSRARAASAQGQPLIVVEGYMDVIALAEAGFTGAVAPLGTALTEDQMMLLWKLLPHAEAREPSRDYTPILCFDGDSAGLRAAARSMERVLPLLTPAQTLRVAFMPEGQDPDDLIKQSGRGAMEAVLRQAKPMIDVIWDMTLAGRSLRTPEDRATFITAIKARAARIAHEDLRRLYQDEIQKRLMALLQPVQSRAPGVEVRRSGGKGTWRAAEPVVPILARRQPVGGRRVRESAMLAIIINHPDLFGDFGEDLAHISFTTPTFEAVRQRVIEILSLESHEPLDAAGLYRHLCMAGEADGAASAALTEILSETTYMHVGFARPGRPLDEARQAWKSIWSKYLQEQLQADLQAAKTRYRQDETDENYARLMALRDEIEGLTKEMDDTDISESA